MIFLDLRAGGKARFVENTGLIFASMSNLLDYHGEMNADMFTKWSNEKCGSYQ